MCALMYALAKYTMNATDEIHIHIVTSLLLPLTSLRNEYARNPAPMPFVIEYVSGMTKTVSRIAKPVAKSTVPVLFRSRSGLKMNQPTSMSAAAVAYGGTIAVMGARQIY